MIRYLILFFLFVNAQAKYAYVDVLRSSHQLDGQNNVKTDDTQAGCIIPEKNGQCLDGSNVVACNCPSGTKCMEITTGNGVCQAQTKRVHIGGVNYDFEAENIIVQDTQMTHDASLLPGYTNENADGGTGVTDAHKKDKYPLYKVTIDGITAAKYNGKDCSVALTSLTGNKLASKFQVLSPSQDESGNAVICSFRVLNKGYLGNVNLAVTFNKNSNLLDAGENQKDKVEMHILSAPGATDDAWIDVASARPFLFPDDATGASSSAVTGTSVFQFELKGSNVAMPGNSSEGGKITLPFKGTFYDKRYLIEDVTSQRALEESIITDARVHKEGLNIHNDYSLWYDSSKDSTVNTGMILNKRGLSDYSKALSSTGKYAEYRLEHDFVMVYGGVVNGQLPHFQPGYLGCTLCPAQLVVGLFGKSGGSHYVRNHAPIDASKLPKGSDKIKMGNITATAITDGYGHKDSVALRLPTNKTDSDGHRLNEFFSFAATATKEAEFDSLDETFNMVTGRLVLSNGDKLGQACNAADKKLYELGPNIGESLDALAECKIQIKDAAEFGDPLNIKFDGTPSNLRIVDGRSLFSGNTELSLLRRKTDTSAIASGNEVTFLLSQVNASAQNFTIKATNKVRGWNSTGHRCLVHDGDKCYCDHASSSDLTCTDSSKVYVQTSNTAGVAIAYSLKSSPKCFDFFDIELHDVSKPWIIYALRLPCVRVTETMSDKLEIYHYFNSSYSLSDDKFSAHIGFEEHEYDDGYLRVLDQGFGGCGREYKHGNGTFDIFSPVGGICTQSWTKGTQPSDGPGFYALNQLNNEDFNMTDLIKCDQGSVSELNDDLNYQITHQLGLIYHRRREFGGTTNEKEYRYETYCQEQDFSLTIRKDASASVQVNTFVSPTLERSVMVSDIDWIQCDSSAPGCFGSEDCFKLQVDLTSRKRNKVSGADWTNGTLNNVVQKSGGENTDSMTVKSALSSTNNGNYFQLVGACGQVVSCDKEEQGNSHYKNHMSTKQQIVMSGVFDGSNVDSDATIETAFEECPLNNRETKNEGGALKMTLALTCTDEDSVGANDITTQDGEECLADISGGTCSSHVQNCKVARQTAQAEVNATLFMDTKDAKGRTEASNQGWELMKGDWYIRRYESKLDGTIDKTKLMTDTHMVSWKNDTTQGCTVENGRIQGLSLFNTTGILKCDNLAIGILRFDLLPMGEARMDAFEVHFDAIMKRRTAFRRLRATYTLQAEPASEANSGGFRVIQASKDISEDVLPSAGGDAPVSDSGKEDMSTEAANDWLVVLIACIAAGVLLIAGIFYCACRRTDDMSAAIATTEEVTGLIDGRSQRFGNLRY